VFAVVFVR